MTHCFIINERCGKKSTVQVIRDIEGCEKTSYVNKMVCFFMSLFIILLVTSQCCSIIHRNHLPYWTMCKRWSILAKYFHDRIQNKGFHCLSWIEAQTRVQFPGRWGLGPTNIYYVSFKSIVWKWTNMCLSWLWLIFREGHTIIKKTFHIVERKLLKLSLSSLQLKAIGPRYNLLVISYVFLGFICFMHSV